MTGFQQQGPPAGVRTCPFCRAAAESRVCPACGRDTTAPRRPCASCGRIVPVAERVCYACGAAHTSEMWWKIPLIVLLFVLAFVVSIVLALLR